MKYMFWKYIQNHFVAKVILNFNNYLDAKWVNKPCTEQIAKLLVNDKNLAIFIYDDCLIDYE